MVTKKPVAAKTKADIYMTLIIACLIVGGGLGTAWSDDPGKEHVLTRYAIDEGVTRRPLKRRPSFCRGRGVFVLVRCGI